MWLDRSRRGKDPLLQPRIWALSLGALLGLLGIGLDNEWIVWGGVGGLAAGILLRAWGRRAARGPGGDHLGPDPEAGEREGVINPEEEATGPEE